MSDHLASPSRGDADSAVPPVQGPARLPVPSLEELAPDIRAVFQRNLERNGYVNNGNWVLAHCPPVFFGLRAFADGIDTSGLLSKRLHHLVAARVAQRVGCPY